MTLVSPVAVMRGPIVAVLVLWWTARVEAAYSWLQQPYNNDDFNTLAKFNMNATLTCNDTTIDDSFAFQYWIRPDTTVMVKEERFTFRTLEGTAAWEVSEDGWNLHLILIHETHFGLYYCVMKSLGNQTVVIKRALNYRGPYFGDLWPKYRLNVIIAGSAAGGVLVLALVFSLIYTLKCQDGEKQTTGAEALKDAEDIGLDENMANIRPSDSGAYEEVDLHVYDAVATERF